VAGDALASVFDADGNNLFTVGDVITIRGANKGGAALPDRTFEIGAANTTGSDAFGTTVQDLMDFLDDVLGIDTTVSGGVTLAGGVISIEGNPGTANHIDLADGNFLLNGTAVTIDWNDVQDADGESLR